MSIEWQTRDNVDNSYSFEKVVLTIDGETEEEVTQKRTIC